MKGQTNVSKKKTLQVTISERALTGRIQRKLKAEGQKLIKSRPDSSAFNNLGAYYIVEGNTVIDYHCELEKLGRELDALKPYEKLEK
jgi:hypothetical protein